MEKDSLLLGRIKEIQKYKLLISLPHNKLGTCLISGVSEEYNSLLSKLVNDSSIMNDVAELSQLFIKGQLVQVKLNNNISNKKIELTMLPSAINSNINIKKLKSGLKLQVAIKSQEDKGYILETGIGGVDGFLPFDQCSESNYKIGKLIEVFPVIDENKKPNGKKCRVVNFTMDLKKRGPILCNSISWDFDSILPGMLIKTNLSLNTKGSLEGKLQGFPVTVNSDHHRITESGSTEQTVTVIGIDNSLKQLDCSLLSHLKLPFKGSEELLNVNIGHSEKNCIIKKKDKNHLIISLPNMKYATAFVKNNHVETDLKDLEEGASVVVRYFDYNLMDNIIIGTTLTKLISLSYFSIHQAKLGEIVKGTVKKFTKSGYDVKISSQLTGLIPLPHLSDKPIANANKLYEIGATVQCRVFHIDEAENRILLTTKKSFLTSKLPIVSGFKDFVVDLLLDGFVAKIMEFGLVVVLFNNIRGWVPIGRVPESKRKSLQISYYVGKPVQVKIVRWKEASNIVELSLNESENVDEIEDENQNNSTIEVGDIYEATISKYRPDGFNVRLFPINKFAFLPFNQLSDSREHRNLFQACYTSDKEDIKISVVVINVNNNKTVVSKKYSLIKAAIKKELLTTRNDVTEDSQWLGWVYKKESYGLIVELPCGIRGLIRNKDVCDYKPVTGQASDIFELGDTVSVKVLEKDPKQANRILFSSKMSHTYRAIEHMGVAAIDFLVNHLEERKYLQATDSCKNVSGLNIGDLVNVMITKQCEWGYTLKLKTEEENESSVAGFIRNQHLPEHVITENSVQRAIIIDIDLKEQAIEVCMISSYVNAVTHRKNDCTRIEVKDKISSEVLAYNNDFVVAMLKGHANGNIVYIPTKRFWNDMAKEFMWTVKQKNATILKKVLADEVFIGSLVINEAINPDDFKDTNKVTLYKDLSRKIKVKNGTKYPVYFHSITKTKIFFYISKLKRGFCNLLDYTTSIEELEDLIARPPERYSLMNKPVTITLTKHKENGLSVGHFLTKEVFEIGDVLCCKITKLISNNKYGLLLPLGVTGCIDNKKGKHNTGSFTPKVGSIVQCKVIEVSKRSGAAYYFMCLYGVKKLENKDKCVEENLSETETEEVIASENEKMDIEETEKENVVETDDITETDINHHQLDDENKENSDSEDEIPIIISGKDNKNENLTTIYKRVHHSDDEEEIVETEERCQPTPAKMRKTNNVEKELLIRNAEKRREAGDYIKNPVNEAEYELSLFNYPNDPNLWIKFMKFYLENGNNVDKARSIAERAMKTLQSKDIESRFKVMKEYLNLEITQLVANKDDEHFDNHVKSFRKIFERALAQKSKFVYLHVCEKLIDQMVLDLAEEFAKRFIKEFSFDSSSWFQLYFVRFLQKKYSVVKETLINAKRCLKADDFRDLTIRVAQVEIERGDSARGVDSLIELFKTKSKNSCIKNRIIAIFEKNNLSQYVPEIESIAQK